MPFCRAFASFCCSIVLCSIAVPGIAAVPSTERAVLIELFQMAGGPNWFRNENWRTADGAFNSPGTECTWRGVTCGTGADGQEHVVAIELADWNMVGELPQDLAALTQLQTFLVYAVPTSGTPNHLSGLLPSLQGLSQLTDFEVGGNQFTGQIPRLSGLTKLQILDVSTNQLSGPIPSLTELTSLTAIYTNQNQLSGPIPPLTGLTSLGTFRAENNNLSGPVPSLADTQSLSQFFVNNNHLTGKLPAAPTSLSMGFARVCPNLLDTQPSSNDTAWNQATGTFPDPWWSEFHSRCDILFRDEFELSND